MRTLQVGRIFPSDFIILAICTVLDILDNAATVVTLPSSCVFRGTCSTYKMIHSLRFDSHFNCRDKHNLLHLLLSLIYYVLDMVLE